MTVQNKYERLGLGFGPPASLPSPGTLGVPCGSSLVCGGGFRFVIVDHSQRSTGVSGWHVVVGRGGGWFNGSGEQFDRSGGQFDGSGGRFDRSGGRFNGGGMFGQSVSGC